MLIRLIYASETAAPMGPTDIQALLSLARRKNRLHDITGLLVFDSRYFLQVLEGDRRVVSELYSRLAQDPRHKRLTIMQADPIDQRRFVGWSMGFAAADALGRGLMLRHGCSGHFDPLQLRASSALALLTEISQSTREDVEEPAAA
jgi:hypothetical protein